MQANPLTNFNDNFFFRSIHSVTGNRLALPVADNQRPIRGQNPDTSAIPGGVWVRRMSQLSLSSSVMAQQQQQQTLQHKQLQEEQQLQQHQLKPYQTKYLQVQFEVELPIYQNEKILEYVNHYPPIPHPGANGHVSSHETNLSDTSGQSKSSGGSVTHLSRLSGDLVTSVAPGAGTPSSNGLHTAQVAMITNGTNRLAASQINEFEFQALHCQPGSNPSCETNNNPPIYENIETYIAGKAS